MTIKHKLIQDFQFLSSDKKIFVLKTGTIIEEYNYKLKSETIPIDKEIVESNPQFFQLIDWKTELISHLKINKIPQPAQIGKKLIPFIEDMILSSMSVIKTQNDNSPNQDLYESKLKELDLRENDIKNKESRISNKEEEIEIRLNRIEKRESSHKEELKELDKREDLLRDKSKQLTERELDIEDKIQDINERERNIDRNLLETSKDIDAKYIELQDKIDSDLKTLSERERNLELLTKELKSKESSMIDKESKLEDLNRNIEIRIDEIKNWESEVRRLDTEIKNWESLHWKMQRFNPPPSAVI